MNDIKRGQKVWASLRNGIKETTVKSVGYKYITLEYDSRILFDRKTLRKAGCGGSRYFIIIDIEKYVKDQDQYYKELIDKIKRFQWESVDREDLDKVADVLKEY